MYWKRVKGIVTSLLFLSALLGVIVFASPSAETGVEEKTIVFWHTETSELTMKIMEDIIADFQQLHPEVNIEQAGVGPFDQITKLKVSLAAGNPPEIAQFSPVGLADQGLLRPLDDVMASIEKPLYESMHRQMGHMYGHWYGIAHAVGTSLLGYRKDWARENGLKAPESWDNWTWDEWIEFSGKLVSGRDASGFINRGDRAAISFEIACWVASNGGRLYDKKTKAPIFTDTRFLEVLDFYKQRNKYLDPGWLNVNYTECMIKFASGKVGQFMTYGRGIHFVESQSPEIADTNHFGVMIKPRGPRGTVGIANQDGEMWIIPKDSKYPETGVEFLKFFFTPEAYKKYCLAYPIQLLPISGAVAEDPEYRANPTIVKWNEWISLQVRQMNEGATVGAGQNGTSQWDETELPWAADVYLSGILGDAVTDVLIEMKTPEQAARRAEERVKELIATGGYKVTQ